MKLSLAAAALASSFLAKKTVKADPPLDCNVFCFRITDIRADGNIDNRYHIEFEVVNWSDAFAGGVRLAMADATPDSVKFANDDFFNLGGVDVDGRPLQLVDTNGDAVISPADFEDTNFNGRLDVGEDLNGNNRLDNDPIPGNYNRPNSFFLSNLTDTMMEWRMGEPIPFVSIVNKPPPICNGCILELQNNAHVVDHPFDFSTTTFNAITGEFDPIEAIDNGDNVQDGFVITIDGLAACVPAQINWFLLGSGGATAPFLTYPTNPECRGTPKLVDLGDPIGTPQSGNNAGFGLVSLVRYDADGCPDLPPFWQRQTGSSQSEKLFFGNVFNTPAGDEFGGIPGGTDEQPEIPFRGNVALRKLLVSNSTEFAVEFSPGLLAPGPDIFDAVPNAMRNSFNGDPHFLRWNQKKRDSFQGECDLVYLKSDIMNVHIRTTIEGFFSYVEETAVLVGNHIVEFHHKKVFLDGKQVGDNELPLKFGDGHRVVLKDAKKHTYYVYANEKTHIAVSNGHKLMKAEVSGTFTDLRDGQGILGEYGTGKMVGRSGRTVDTFEEFGHEWQVHPDEDKQLFMNARSPQFPYERCRMPTQSRESRRHLRAQNPALLEKATEACAVYGDDKDLCIEDVVATGDLDLASAW